jgi:hypothetical protein
MQAFVQACAVSSPLSNHRTKHPPKGLPDSSDPIRQDGLQCCNVKSWLSQIKSFGALAPSSMLLFGSIVLLSKTKNVGSLLQVLGAGCLNLVILAHIAEALHWFAFMHWGQEHSIGHYLDLTSAILGITLFPLGYLLHAWGIRRGR